MSWILAEVALNVPLHDSFYYIVPENLLDEDLTLKRVIVHFGRREEVGFVMRVIPEKDAPVDLSKFKSVSLALY